MTLAAALFSAAAVFGQRSTVRDIDIDVVLDTDGSAYVTENWNVDIHRGTEWYLVRNHLDEMRISELSVTDETGLQYTYEGEWDTDRNLSRKAGRCGIVTKPDGCEICWGLGSYGEHLYSVRYRMTNVVLGMDDSNSLHVQFVSPGISPYPKHARVTIRKEGTAFGDDNAGIWAFGFNGEINFKDGKIVAETLEPFANDEYSLIVLARFDSGLFKPEVHLEQTFQQELDAAFEGSSYRDYLIQAREEKIAFICITVFAIVLSILLIAVAHRRKRKQNLRFFGVENTDGIGYERELPFDGNLLETRYVLARGHVLMRTGEGGIASAMILKMLKDGVLAVSAGKRGKPEISFPEPTGLSELSKPERKFYDFLKEAAAENGILEGREFSRWASRHTKEVNAWVNSLTPSGSDILTSRGHLAGDTLTPEGQKHARRTLGFRKYLKDFTIIGERTTAEVALWRDYIIYAALYGIAEQVARELKDINPELFEETVGYDYPMMRNVLLLSDRMGNSVVEASAKYLQTASSVGGHGGFSSFGGGGGFHGGGFGGGAR